MKTLRDLAAEIFGHPMGCRDGSCVWGPLSGMHTNSGCQCLKCDGHALRTLARRLSIVAQHLHNRPATSGDEEI